MARISDFLRRGFRGADVKNSALRTIEQIWNVQRSEIARHEDGFDWLPGSHIVRVRIHEHARPSDGAPRFRISIDTDYLRSVPIHDKKFVRFAGLCAKIHCPTYSWVYPPSDIAKAYFGDAPLNLQLCATAYFDEVMTPWMPSFMAQMSIIQPINAENLSASAPRVLFGEMRDVADDSRKTKFNDVLRVAHEIHRAEGAKPCKWIGTDEFETFALADGGNDNCLAAATKEGMTFETPFGDAAALLMFKCDQKHPLLGNGLLIATIIPPSKDEDAFAEAANLNFLESRVWTNIPQLGCWHPHADEERLAHSYFVPNALYKPNLVAHLAHWAIHRVQWVRRTRFPDVKDLTMSEILKRRLPN